MNKRLILLIIFLLTTHFIRFVPDLYAAERQPVLWSIRSMGMGGAGIVVANTDDSIIFNPACVSSVPGPKLTIVAPSVGIADGIVSEISYVIGELATEIMSMSDIADIANNDKMKEWLNAEHNIGFDPGFSLSFVSPLKFKDYQMGCGFGVYGNALANLGIGQGVWSPFMDIDVIADGVGVGAVAFDIFSPIDMLNPITVGISAKLLARAKIDEYESLFSMIMESASSETYWVDKFSNFLQTGIGVGIDLGFLYKWSDGDVGVGLTVKNLGGLKLGYASGAATIPQIINFGWGCNYGKLILACDVHDVLGTGDLLKKVHIGAEYPLGALLFLRGGFSSGWPTAGARLAIDLIIVKFYIEYALTANELGEYAGQWGDYYHRASITMQFF